MSAGPIARLGTRLSAGLVPERRRGVELLDDPAADAALATRSLRDVALANRCFGGAAAVLFCIRPVLSAAAQPRSTRAELTMLDVGTGQGDIPVRARALATRLGTTLTTIGIERTLPVAAAARARAEIVCVGDALALPFPDRSVDIVICSQVLHHFGDAEAMRLVREMDRVARALVVIADLRRSWLAAAGIWASSFALGFHPVSRHDGVLSVLRGYRGPELALLVNEAVGAKPRVRDRPGFRVTACWSPG